MMENIRISGFADEIDPALDEQLKTVTSLGMHYISLRSADGKGVADYTPEEARTLLLPRLEAAGVGVSSLGSPIGKVGVNDEEGFAAQCEALKRLCETAAVLKCRFIRMFSFYIPEGEEPEKYTDTVIAKLRRFLEIAAPYDVVLMHENEKDIYGDTGARCKTLMDTLGSEQFCSAFDFANFVQCGEDPEQCWELLRPYIRYIHIKDAKYGSGENVVAGTGDGKIAKLLARAIRDEGYEGFLTLEPHLVLFASLASLETKAAGEVIKENKAANGAQGYTMQYNALKEILDAI